MTATDYAALLRREYLDGFIADDLLPAEDILGLFGRSYARQRQ